MATRPHVQCVSLHSSGANPVESKNYLPEGHLTWNAMELLAESLWEAQTAAHAGNMRCLVRGPAQSRPTFSKGRLFRCPGTQPCVGHVGALFVLKLPCNFRSAFQCCVQLRCRADSLPEGSVCPRCVQLLKDLYRTLFAFTSNYVCHSTSIGCFAETSGYQAGPAVESRTVPLILCCLPTYYTCSIGR
jgi:hypothetical protein